MTVRAHAAAQPTEHTVVEGYTGNLGCPCVSSMEEEDNQDHLTLDGTNTFSILVDSGATAHYLDSDLIPELPNILKNYARIQQPMKIIGAGGHEFYGVGEGVISVLVQDEDGINRRVQFKCTTVPGLGRHLFSTGTAQKEGAHTIMSDQPRIEIPAGLNDEPGYALALREEGTLYYLDVTIDGGRGTSGRAYPVGRAESINLWHRRLAHCHRGILQAAAKIKEAGVILRDELSPCKTCNMQKSTQKKHPKTTSQTAELPGQRVYTDLLGKISPPAKGGYTYVSKFTDEYSRMNAVYLLKTKNEAVDSLGNYVKDIIIPNGFRLERIRSDCGGEYVAEYYKKYCKSTGIVQEFTAPATPQQNGISERAGRTLMNIVRCLLYGGGLPEFLWGELCCTAVYITNRLPHVNMNNETPYFRMFGKQAPLQHLRVIGSSAFVHVETYTAKLDTRAWQGQLVGYSPDSKAYRIYNPHTRKVVSSRNVTFIENMDAAMPPAGTSDSDDDENISSSSSDVTTSGNEGEKSDNFLHNEDEDVPDDSSSSSEEEESTSDRRNLRSNTRRLGCNTTPTIRVRGSSRN